MIYFLYGEDTYRSKEKLKEIIDGYKEKHKSGLSLKVFDLSEGFNLEELETGASQVSMFKEKKMVVLLNPFPDLKDDFPKNILKSDDLFIIFQEGSADSKTAFYRFLKANAKCQKFEYLEGSKLKTWALNEFNKYRAKTEPFVIEKLLARTGADLWRLSNEILKLSCFKKGGCVSPKDIDLFIRPKIESDIFKTIDAIALKNKKEALGLLHKHILNGDSPVYLLSMINYQFRNVINIKDLIERKHSFPAIAKKSGLHPYVVKKTFYQAQNFSSDSLKKIYQKIFQTDIDIKTGKTGAEDALDMVVMEI